MLSLSSFRNALHSLDRAIAQPKNEFTRDAVIQRFEYTFELAWKAMKRYFKENQNWEDSNIKNIFREAARQNLLDSCEDWFAFHRARNLTSHTYNEETAEEVYQQAKIFAVQAQIVLSRLENLE